MKNSLVSIVIVNYNGEEYLFNCIKSVLDSRYKNIEIIVVDNMSNDRSLDILRNSFHDERIRIIKNDNNVGFAAGNNIGYKNTAGQYIVLLNVDTVVDPTWLNEIICIMDSDSTIGAAQPKLLNLDNQNIYDSAGDYIDYFGFSFIRGGQWSERDTGQYDIVEEIFSARGAALVTTRAVVEEIGLFDESLFMSYEDIDFSWRIYLAGKRIVYIPNSIVYHKGSGIISKQPPAINLHVVKNRYVCLIKNYDTSNMVKYALLPLIVDIISGYFLLGPILFRHKNKLLTIRGKLFAYYWILSKRSTLIKHRNHVQKHIRRVPDSIIMKRMVKSSLWDLLKLIINVLRFGKSCAVLLYFRKGLGGK
jgi:GT2 family glycosyltransferase